MMATQKGNRSNSIVTSSNKIICRETSIQLSDEKLKGVLSKVYEAARKDACKFKPYKHYGIFISIAGTLLITLLTTEFKAIGSITATDMKTGAWVLFGISAIIGFALALWNVSKQHVSENEERDKTIHTTITDILKTYRIEEKNAPSE